MIFVLVNNKPVKIEYKPLPFGLIKDNYISKDFSAYENSLLEIINFSSYFKKLTHHSKFYLIDNQSNGECDAKAEWETEDEEKKAEYQIDFKLLISESIMRERIKIAPRADYKFLEQNIILVDKKNDKEQQYDDELLAALFNISDSDLAFIGRKEKSKNNLINDFLKNIGKDKNLLYFFPYEVTNENPLAFLICLDKCLSKCIEYRNKIIQKDFFIVYYQNRKLHLCKYIDGHIKLIESIDEIWLESFRRLKAITNFNFD